ncbi:MULTISPECIES: hypothetical protein [unclassified Variovorax]|uniref:hypothetical protein n=1 Tax=unclassified Variovorax TaxID=663243 RepID=UPI0015C70E87|nr:hypothetical protein [Variovorax sp. YR752]
MQLENATLRRRGLGSMLLLRGPCPMSPANHRKMLARFLHPSLKRTKRKPRSALPSASTGMPAARKAMISASIAMSDGSFKVIVAL